MSDTEKPSWEWRALVDELRAELDGAEHLLVQKDHALRTMREEAMSEPLKKYELEYDLEGSGFYRLHECYLAADVDAILRQREEKLAETETKAKALCCQNGGLMIENHDLKEQLATVTAERDEALKKARWKHTHDDSLELELRQRLATTTAHLEAQRTATYQAVEREHTAKRQLADVTQERDALRLRIKTVDAERAQLAEDRRKMSEEYEAWCLEDV